MIEVFGAVLVFILRAVYFVLEIVAFFSNLKQLARWATGSATLVDVPAEPKILSPAARRALEEAEQRRAHAASGSVQAS
ncbi:hypothetical protein JQ634_08490 [Bradyrhizobium sp. AUGA SZCCT0240]|uniref:hypothetical protein n=1 Tax=unclassified Bradyrhizobium TaxID=2631580 RepID=UPI001BAC2EAA|nr:MULTISPECIES: hypothetical protein [unclassified Bradyrhizobium]MBR1198446.1 hypothetical protein [Bradyrhizobium sp. AUGA SZCCT0158]MBR1243129.1 hypothetical protein [Bradyrhizobium sp. AUGA SZCCT0274]MBR1253739.1 hypothetical protein [Bradyrhizobium sp. AUGA SZCCT0240]